MYIEMELLARERYETRLREAEEMHRHRSLSGRTAQHDPVLPDASSPRLRQR